MANRSVASTSSSSAGVDWKYDVFLSFRGADTRMSITYELYDGLQNKRGIKTFMDDHDLEVGDPISPTLLKAIEQSRFAIIVLSPNFACSTWCLEELAKICECMKDDHNRILPLFYNVDPTDVRYQKKSFGEAFTRHQGSAQHAAEKLQLWRDALKTTAGLSGWHTTNFKTDRELVDSIVSFLCSKVQSIEIESTLATSGDFQAFKAPKTAMHEIMKALQDKEITALGVYGMGGVGKTTLVKHVGAEAYKKKFFGNVIMVVVSQSPQVHKIQQTIAEQLGIYFPENSTESGRASRLYKEIMRKHNILIILDDIWKFIDLSTVGIPTYHELNKCNSKVLLTTRILHVSYSMKTQASIPLSILSDEDSWTLFVTEARRSFEQTKFNDIAWKVAGECKGLPIALIAVARALGDKDLVEWEKAAQRLEKSQSATLDDELDAYRCIKLSYDYLRDEDSKACFLLCCLFPEDCEIKIEDLLKYAVGIGLFRDCETMYEARGRAESVVKYLKDSSLLLEDKEEYHGFVNNYVDYNDGEYVRMHDVIRDTAMNIAKSFDGHEFFGKAGCGLKEWPRLLSEGYTAVSLMWNGLRKLPIWLVCPKLQILLLNNNGDLEQIPESFLLRLNDLKVLDLGKTSISLLPQTFGLLTNLRVLNLDYLRITDISMVGKLTNLEILNMRGIYLKELPGEIRDLSNLKVLDTSGGNIDRIPSKLISKLHCLEELYLEYKFCYCASTVDGERDEACFDEVTSLPKLKFLKAWISNVECIPKNVEFNPNWVRFNICIDSEKRFRYGVYHDTIIRLNLKTRNKLPDWFIRLMVDKVQNVEWIACRRSSCVDSDYENSVTLVPGKPVLQNLIVLELAEVDCQGFCVTEFAPGSFLSLRYLDVRFCYNWGRVLLPSTLLQRLENLEVLECRFMEEVEYLFQFNAILEPKQSTLRHVMCYDLVTVRNICNGPAPRAWFQNLQSLTIQRCNLEGSLFTSDVAQCLFQLKKLDLYRCPTLERIVEATDKRIILPKLEVLRLMDLPMLYYESTTMIFECPSLYDFCVERCPKFSVSASDFRRKGVEWERKYTSDFSNESEFDEEEKSSE